jgi:hypothetical protein
MVSMPRLGLTLLSLLMACSPAPVHGRDRRQAQEYDIEGRYIVAYVDEAHLVIGIKGSQPTVYIQDGRLHFQSQCIYADWTYRREREAIDTDTYYQPGSAMCARGLTPGEKSIQTKISAADTVRRVRGGLYLAGPRGSVQLEQLIEPTELARRAVDLRGAWRVTAIDDRWLGTAIPLTADWEPGCAMQYRGYRIEGGMFVADPVNLSGIMRCDIGYPQELEQVWAALDAADTVERTANGDVRIAGGGRSVLLARK